ncbi:MAG: DUF72 domain-containing protein [Armatimonadetes bacterium]|nr:DUF72 domain-containing protein [Armatimonadota bacterium]
MAARLYAGTSGFSYPEWRGNFYPKDLPQEEMLRYYSRIFPSVELNNTFYRFPRTAQVQQWRKATPRGFRFSVKAHRLITHIRRLRNAEEVLRVQLERVADLRDRAGPLLFQLPPSLQADLPLLRDFLYLLPPRRRAVEFRHASWYDDAVYALLEEHHTALTIMESDEDEPVLQFVGPFVYLRLHRSSYSPATLRAWIARIREQLARQKDVYAYFTHEEGAPAPDYARRLRTLVEGG